jgi:P4 family phage/plasmid primase-like protien
MPKKTYIPKSIIDLDGWGTDEWDYANRFAYTHRLDSPTPIKMFLGLAWARKTSTKWELIKPSHEALLVPYIVETIDDFKEKLRLRIEEINEKIMVATAEKNALELDRLNRELEIFEKITPKRRNNNLITNIKKLAASVPGGNVDYHEVDKVDPDRPETIYTINTPNGLIDLRTGRYIETPQDLYITKCTAVAPSPNHQYHSDKWQKTVEAILPDRAVRRYMQKVLGMALIAKKTDDLFIVCQGSGGNGKTTLLNTVATALGADYVSNITSKSLMDSYKSMSGGGVATPDIADLRGKRLALLSETKENDYFDTGIIKLLSGGGIIRARYLRQNPIEFIATHLIILDTNYIPRLKNVADKAFRSRLVIIPFTQVFDRHNNTLKTDLLKKEVLEDVLLWLIEGARLYLEEGLESGKNLPKAMQDMLAKYYDDNDAIHAFILDRCVQDRKQVVSLKDLYSAYAEWHRDEYGGVNKDSNRTMSAKLRAQVCWDQVRDAEGGFNYVKSPDNTPYNPVVKRYNHGNMVLGLRLKTYEERNITIRRN